MNTEKTIPQIQSILDRKISEGVTNKIFPCASVGYSNCHDRAFSHSPTMIPETPFAVSENSLYDIASIQKSMVAIIALQLIENGIIRLEEPIYHAVGGTTKSWKRIQVKHLLTNSLEFDITEKLHFMTPQKVKERVLNANVIHLGEGYRYHNTTSIILGWFLEKILGKNIQHLLEHKIFRPAGMHETFFWSNIPSNLRQHVIPSEICPLRGPLRGTVQDEITSMYASHNIPIAAAGVFSTVFDLIKFGEFVISGAFKKPDKVHTLMLKNYLAKSGSTFGLGFDVPRPEYLGDHYAGNTLYHTGFSGGSIQVQPRLKKVVVVLTNATYPTRGVRGPQSPLYGWRKSISAELLANN